MESCLVDHLIDLMEHLTQVGDPSGFIPGARAHPDWSPFLTKIARERKTHLRLGPMYDIDDLVSLAETHMNYQAELLIKDPQRPSGGLRLDPKQNKAWNWKVLIRTAEQGMRRPNNLRTFLQNREREEVIETVAEVLDRIWMSESDMDDAVVLLALARRRWFNPSTRSLSLRGEPNIEAAARRMGLSPRETVAGVIQRFRKTILGDATIDRRWAKRILSYIDRAWTF